MSAALSYVVVTDAPGTIRRVLECLRGQTARRAVEVVIVTTTGAEAAIRAGTPDEFAAVRVVALPSIWPMAVARAAGVRAARAEVVFIGETHSFPQPGFAAAVIEAAARPWDVLVPGLDNANPGTAISWSNFLLDYGSWHPVLPGGAIPGGPTWNVAYRRAVLRAVDGSLERMFGHGDDLAVAFHAARGGSPSSSPRRASITPTCRGRAGGSSSATSPGCWWARAAGSGGRRPAGCSTCSPRR